ncbi:MAG: hypothetical protein HC883_03960 [Bdellovibrionaceae bacterium]|nr:hypothetical protein [Pseudobdellovibrionaceae bacterium]
MIPPIGVEFLGGYQADDGNFYAVMLNLLGYDGNIAAIDPAGLPVLPWYVVPRHWVVESSDGVNTVRFAVVCPTPFLNHPPLVRQSLATSSGLTVGVLGRVGESWSQFEV